ncbi:hypothetical protein GCM10023116_16410 [Kistimonas scapharcae]|uniref:UDP-N-acetylglucosamine:LPS N-acetylglucosamine transferase n=1 Tax=Kistimonas scapharcae TaxID=1036133 RepID=A0ABP8V3E2_9GAMM
MKTRLSLSFFVFLSCLLATGCSSFARQTESDPALSGDTVDIVLIANDQGESQVFKLLLPELARRNLSTQVLTMGQADTVFTTQKEVVRLNTLGSLSENAANDRTQRLDKETLERIATQLRPAIVVTGMSHAIQAQLANRFKTAGATTMAFYDNFDLVSQAQFAVPWLETTSGVDELLLPGHYQAVDAGKLPAFANSQISISGNPALEQWDIVFLVANPVQEKQRLALDPKRPVILFTGGYGDEYEHWLQLFLQAMAERPDLQVLIAPHPKTDGQLERSSVAALKLTNVSVRDGALSTAQLATAADLVVTHKSTTGFQAAWQGLPVLFVAADDYTNILIDAGLASRASSWQQILNNVHRTIDQPRHRETVSFQTLGVPEQSLQRIADHLQTTRYQVVGAGSPILEQLQVENN